MKEARREMRIPHDISLHFSIYGDPAKEHHRCNTVDVSNSGLGIMSETPLEFGQFIEFENKSTGTPTLNAVVQWCLPVDGKFRAGLYLF